MEQRPFDLLVAGELNIDLIMDDLAGPPEVGKEQLAGSMNLVLGSSSAIFAANCSSLGIRVAFAGWTGKDPFGDFVQEALREKGVDTRFVSSINEQRTGATVAFNFGQERMMVTHAGAMSAMGVEDLPIDSLSSVRHLHVSSVFLQPSLLPGLPELFRKAQQAGATTSLDPQWDPAEQWRLDLDRILPHLDFFLPNEKELLLLTGCDTVERAAGELSLSECRLVVKQGERGATLFRPNDTAIHEPACRLTGFVDAIGAGDSFDAGLITAHLKGWDERRALRFANIAGAVSTTAAGGTGAIRSFQQIMETATRTGYSLDETAGEVPGT